MARLAAAGGEIEVLAASARPELYALAESAVCCGREQPSRREQPVMSDEDVVAAAAGLSFAFRFTKTKVHCPHPRIAPMICPDDLRTCTAG